MWFTNPYKLIYKVLRARPVLFAYILMHNREEWVLV